MNFVFRLASIALISAIVTGCSSYRWTSRVPEELRTVAVPTFENRTESAELGPIVTEYTLREFQKEGTFKIKRTGDSAIEIQGAIIKASRGGVVYNRNYGMRAKEYRYTVTAEVSIINKETGKVLQEARKYFAETTFITHDDLLTSQHNAAQRIASELARQIVDDTVSYPYNRPASEEVVKEVEAELKK
jgi:hypothetical protein